MELARISGSKLKLALAVLLAAGLFAAWAASAGAASVPSAPAEPQAQIDATGTPNSTADTSGCKAVLTNTRLVRVQRNSLGAITLRLVEQTWVTRCPAASGGTTDSDTRRLQVWVSEVSWGRS